MRGLFQHGTHPIHCHSSHLPNLVAICQDQPLHQLSVSASWGIAGDLDQPLDGRLVRRFMPEKTNRAALKHIFVCGGILVGFDEEKMFFFAQSL